MNEGDSNAFEPMIDNNYFHVDVHEWNHHEMKPSWNEWGAWKKWTFNAKIVNYLKWKNERKECPLSFFTFKVVPQWFFVLQCVLQHEWKECTWKIVKNSKRSRSTKNCKCECV
jgi:hypothetical protein